MVCSVFYQNIFQPLTMMTKSIWNYSQTGWFYCTWLWQTNWLSFWLWLKEKFKDLPLNNFWNYLTEEYLNVDKHLVQVLLPFATANLRETGFWHYAAIKDIYRTRLDAADDIRIQLSSIVPNIKTNLWWKKAEKSTSLIPQCGVPSAARQT